MNELIAPASAIPFLQDLAVGGLLVKEERRRIDGLVELSHRRVDADLAEERFHAKGAGFVRHDGNHARAQRRVAQQLGQHAHECHGRGGGALTASLEFGEDVWRKSRDLALLRRAHWHEPAELFATGGEVTDFAAIRRRAVERRATEILIRNRDLEPIAKLHQLVFIELLLLMRHVAAFAGLAEPVTLDRARQHHRRGALVPHRRVEGRVDLARVMPPKVHAHQLVVAAVGHHGQQSLVHAVEVLADVGPAGHAVFLILPVDDLAGATREQPVVIVGEQLVPIAAPEDLDHIPAGAAKQSFQLLHDVAVTANRAVQALQVAIDHPGQVVQVLAPREGYRRGSLRRVGFSITDKRPHPLVGGLLQSPILQIAHEPRLVDRHQRSQAHGHGGELPEIGHQPGMWVRRDAAAGRELTPEVVDLLGGQATLEIRPRINAGRHVALEVNDVRPPRGDPARGRSG